MGALRHARRRNLLLTGLALAAGAGIVFGLDSLNRSTERVREGLAAKQSKLEKYREKLLDMEGMQRQLAALQNTLTQTEVGLLTGRTPSLAAAEIQEIVTGIANSAGGQISTVRVLQPQSRSGQAYVVIPVEITLGSTLRELTRLLYRIDSSAKLLRVSQMEIKSRAGLVRRGDRVNLVTTMTVEGFVRKTNGEG